MKKLFKLLTLIAFGAAVTWLLRDQLVPGPTAPNPHPPPFRHPPGTAPVAAAPVEVAAMEVGAEDLTKVNGIGPVYAARLDAAGITTFRGLAAADADRLAADAGLPRDKVADWIGKAADLA